MVQNTYLLNNSDICSSLANICRSHSLESMKKCLKEIFVFIMSWGSRHGILWVTKVTLWHELCTHPVPHTLVFSTSHARAHLSLSLFSSTLTLSAPLSYPLTVDSLSFLARILLVIEIQICLDLLWFFFPVTTVPVLETCSTVAAFRNSALHRGLSTSF